MQAGYTNLNNYYFDTLKIQVNSAAKIRSIAEAREVNFRYFDEKHVGIAIDETTSQKDVLDILYIFAEASGHSGVSLTFSDDDITDNIPGYATRQSIYLTHPVSNTHHSGTEMMR